MTTYTSAAEMMTTTTRPMYCYKCGEMVSPDPLRQWWIFMDYEPRLLCSSCMAANAYPHWGRDLLTEDEALHMLALMDLPEGGEDARP